MEPEVQLEQKTETTIIDPAASADKTEVKNTASDGDPASQKQS